jgi:hypothetical protein
MASTGISMEILHAVWPRISGEASRGRAGRCVESGGGRTQRGRGARKMLPSAFAELVEIGVGEPRASQFSARAIAAAGQVAQGVPEAARRHLPAVVMAAPARLSTLSCRRQGTVTLCREGSFRLAPAQLAAIAVELPLLGRPR